MSRKRRSRRDKRDPNADRSVTGGGRLAGRLVWLVVTLGIVGLGWLMLTRVGAHRVELPEIDLGSMEPQVREAIIDSRALAVEQPTAENLGALGELLQAHGLDAEASVCYRQAIALEDDFRWRYLDAHAVRAVAPDEALEQARRAVELKPDYSPAHVVIGQLLEQDGLVEEARAAYRAGVDADERSATAVFGYGRSLLSLGELESALKELTGAAELAPESSEIRAALAQAYRRLGDRQEAARQAKLASESEPAIAITDPVHFRMRQRSRSSITMLQRALEARDASRFDEAESILRELVELRPDDANILAELGDTLAMTERFDEARELYAQALTLNPDTPGALYGLGNAMNLDGDYAGAEANYRRATELRPEHVPTWLNLGGLLVYQGRLDEAEEAFREALRRDPTGFGANRQLGQLLLRRRRLEPAIDHLAKALAASPDSGPVNLQLSIAYAASGRIEEAREHARRADRLGEVLPPPVQRLLEGPPS